MAHSKALLAWLLVLGFAAPARAQLQSEFYIPVPENEALEALDDVNANADDPVRTYVSLTIANECVVYYDHWEDGYEVVLDAPVQGTTAIWGNGNGTDGVPPGFGSDPNPIPSGSVLVLANAVSTGMTTGDEDPNAPGADSTLQGTIDFDGRDRVGLTCASAMTRAAWASNSGTLNAGAVEVWPVSDLGTLYELPIGEDTPGADQDFEITNISIMAFEDGTNVDIDHDADGLVDISVSLDQGESYYVDSSSLAVNAGATVTASATVQVHLMTGDENTSYAARWYTVLPVSSWDSCYTTPTNSQPGATATRVFLYNPNGSAITVDTVDGTGAVSSVNVPAAGSAIFDMPSASVGVELCSDDGSVFYAGAAVDHGSTTHDWGHTLVPVELQTNQLLIPWADGCDPTIACTENGSPVWVTPVCDTYIYADFDQDGTPDKVDLNGDGDTSDTVDGHSEATSDLGILVSRLDRLLVHDPSDGNQTGALIYSLDGSGNSGNIGCDLAGVWGQNGEVASGGTPAIDVGTLIVPFGADVVIEKATNGVDADGEQQAVLIPVGDPVTWTYVVTNTGDFPLADAVVTDDQLLATDISCDASTAGDGTDLDGNNVIAMFNPGESVTCTASGVAAAGRYTNLASVSGTPDGVTGLPATWDVTDTDPSNYFGYNGSIEVVKDLIPESDPGLFDLRLGGVTEAADVTDGGTTGVLGVDPGTHTVGELGGTGTTLSHYDNDISCIENVGRCVGAPSVACTDDSFCDTTCDLTPYVVATCTDCTSLDVDVPAAESDIVCTVTNTNKCAGSACGDGLFCNGAEVCEPTSGACVPGTPVECNDGVSCTTDVCDEGSDQCVNTPVDSVCNDGAFCNGVETCDATNDCQAGAAPVCDDGVSCTNDSCDEAGDQCVNSVDDSICNDGAFCNGVETCDATNDCQAGAAPVCDDGVSCTSDSCDEAGDQCVNAADDSVCSDGAFCNGAETCDPTNGCEAGAPPVCDDGVACTNDSCDEAGDQCVNATDDAICNDGAFCNGVETCDATNDCQAGTAPACADGVSCTNDSCDEDADQCVNTPDDSICSDGAFCNGTESCDPINGCQAGPAPVCEDGIACTTDFCDENADQCVNAVEQNACAEITLAKTAGTTVLGEPGGDVEFTFVVENISDTTGVTIDTLFDDVFGDLTLPPGTCAVPQPIPAMGSYECTIERNVLGNAGDVHMNTAEASGTDDLAGHPVHAEDSAQIQFVDTTILGCLHCPAKVTFRKKGLDRFSMQGLLPLPLDFDPSLSGFEIRLSNSSGDIFVGELQVGDLEKKGKNFQFKDKLGKKGLGSRDPLFRVQFRPFHGDWKVKVQGYADLSAADEANMTLTLVVGGVVFEATHDWDQRKNGWQLKRLPL